jgi:hypothetical protein
MLVIDGRIYTYIELFWQVERREDAVLEDDERIEVDLGTCQPLKAALLHTL